MNTVLIYAIPIIVVIVLGTIVTGIIKKKRIQSRTSPYIEALHLLFEEKYDEAQVRLTKTVKRDSDNVMAYILLGHILRIQGHPNRAAKLHRNLLVRTDLSEAQQNSVLHHLVLDYDDDQMMDKAIQMAEDLVQRTKKDVDNEMLLLTLYEKKGDWDKAFFHRQHIDKWLKKKENPILALYKVQSGKSHIEKGAEKEGRIRFREAIKLDKHCIPAYLLRGDSYRRENRNEDAFSVWKDFSLKNPEWAHLAFKRLKEVLFDLGRYGDTEQIYQQIIEKKPSNDTVYLNLAELYRKQGKIDEAFDLCRNVLDKHPDSPRGRLLFVQLLQQKGDNQALPEAIKFLSTQAEHSTEYQCNDCHVIAEEPVWHCPECGAWNSYLT